MPRKIVVCTDHSVTWECLRRFSAGSSATLERVARLEDLTASEGLEVDAVVVDDRFLPIIHHVERSARRHSPLFHNAVFMTAGEALDAMWSGPLSTPEGYSSEHLADWVHETRIQATPSLSA